MLGKPSVICDVRYIFIIHFTNWVSVFPLVTFYSSMCCRKTGRSDQKVRQSPEWPERGSRWQNQTQRFRREPEASKTENTQKKYHDAQNARTEIGFQRVLLEFDFIAKLSKFELHGLPEDNEKTWQGTCVTFNSSLGYCRPSYFYFILV